MERCVLSKKIRQNTIRDKIMRIFLSIIIFFIFALNAKNAPCETEHCNQTCVDKALLHNFSKGLESNIRLELLGVCKRIKSKTDTKQACFNIFSIVEELIVLLDIGATYEDCCKKCGDPAWRMYQIRSVQAVGLITELVNDIEKDMDKSIAINPDTVLFYSALKKVLIAFSSKK